MQNYRVLDTLKYSNAYRTPHINFHRSRLRILHHTCRIRIPPYTQGYLEDPEPQHLPYYNGYQLDI